MPTPTPPPAPLATPTREMLAALLQLSPASVQQAVNDARTGQYRTWQVPKGGGRLRDISEPSPALKSAQLAMLEHLLYRVSVSPFAHGFVPGRSIVTNARVHVPTATSLVSCDLKDAFPSVSRQQVRTVLEWRLGAIVKHAFPSRSRQELCDAYDALADMATFKDALPQGAPTSGALLNLACARLDRRVVLTLLQSPTWRRELPQLRYTRYADDLTFTAGLQGHFPSEFLIALNTVVRKSGFKLNPRKISVLHSRQQDLVICGVRLHNGQLALPRATLQHYRAVFDQALAYRVAEIPTELRQTIEGIIGLLRMIYPCCPQPLIKPLERLIVVHGDWLRRKPLLPDLSLNAYSMT